MPSLRAQASPGHMTLSGQCRQGFKTPLSLSGGCVYTVFKLHSLARILYGASYFCIH